MELKSALENLSRFGSEVSRDWIRSNTEINIYRGEYGTAGVDNWDGLMNIDFMGATISSTRVQTWADHPVLGSGDGTLRPGSYTGSFYKNRTYADRIYLNDSGFQIHSTLKLDNTLATQQGSAPRSKGCIIADASDYDKFSANLESIGFKFESNQTINVNFNLSRNNVEMGNNYFKHYIGTHGVEYNPARYVGEI